MPPPRTQRRVSKRREKSPDSAFLTCDLITNEMLSQDQPRNSPACLLCDCPLDSIEHILAICRATADTRNRLLPELLNTVAKVQPLCAILDCYNDPAITTQFILDCSSPNLPESFRIPSHNPDITDIFRVSRDWTYSISSERTRLLSVIQ